MKPKFITLSANLVSDRLQKGKDPRRVHGQGESRPVLAARLAPWLGVALLLTALSPAQKDPFLSTPFEGPNQLILPDSISLEISSSEVNRGADERAVVIRSFSEIDQPLDTRVTRGIASLWQYLLPEGGDPNSLDIALGMVAANGEADRLSLANGNPGWIAIKLEPTRPTLVSKTKRGLLLEGGALLELDLANARQAGRYVGTLIVTIHQL